MSLDIDQLLSTPSEIVPDTHAFRKILPNRNVIIAIQEVCHDLIIADMKGEKVHYKDLINLMARLSTDLTTKYVLGEKPTILPQRLEATLRKHRANDCDCLLAGVALKRQIKTRRNTIIVTDDHAFHNTPDFRSKRIYPIYVSSFIKQIQAR